MTIAAAQGRRFNASREQWQKTWRTARVMASQGRDPEKFHHYSLIWRAFIIAVDERHDPFPSTPRQRLSWNRAGPEDCPF